MSLLEPVYDDVVRYIRAMTRNAEDTRDVLGETLLTAYERFDEVRNPASFKFFMITIARRAFSQTIWKRRFFTHIDRKTLEAFWDSMTPPDLASDIALLYEMLHKLPLKQRDAIVLFELQGFSLQEIRDMTAEMLEAQREWLPQFAGKSLRPLGNIATPPGTVGVSVPLDPALAINNRFGKLASG